MKKMDERERHIQLLAQERAYKILMLALCGWTMYDCWACLAQGAEYQPLPGLLVCGAVALQGFYGLFLRRKMVEADEEYREPNHFLRALLGAAAAAAILMGAGGWLAGLGA